MIRIIITAYGEPKATERAINALLSQKIRERYEILVVDPFPKVEKYIKKKFGKSEKVRFYRDVGEGKAFVLNILLSKYFSENEKDIFIFTDGDVYVSKNSVNALLAKFKDPKIGCVTGHPVSINSREEKYGYFSHVAFDGAHNLRKRLSKEGKFFECSGYLFAIRNGVISEFPLDCSEDSIIPFLFWQKGYKIAYSEDAKVHVINPTNFQDYVTQKVRNIKGHENLNKYFKLPNAPPRTKSFMNEIREGFFFTLLYPGNLREFVWTIQLYALRLYIYYKAFKELRRGKGYSDGWRETEIKSTKPFD